MRVCGVGGVKRWCFGGVISRFSTEIEFYPIRVLPFIEDGNFVTT